MELTIQNFETQKTFNKIQLKQNQLKKNSITSSFEFILCRKTLELLSLTGFLEEKLAFFG
jgi:hypothetical protein